MLDHEPNRSKKNDKILPSRHGEASPGISFTSRCWFNALLQAFQSKALVRVTRGVRGISHPMAIGLCGILVTFLSDQGTVKCAD